ncbi:MAG: N-sulfoglucosamine sulfohydrolase [Verrucomicrobiota bacterium]|jgi:arylsulfatase A-like enzyme
MGYAAGMKHERALVWLGTIWIGFVLPATSAESAVPKRRLPNIVICVADDWSWPHAGAYGDRVVKTPNFDRVAREGVLFALAFCAAPSCTPSRSALLTGQAPHRLGEGANLWGFLPNRFPVYPDLLEAAGYIVGLQGKGWGPGNFLAGGRTRNPAGPGFKGFKEFLGTVPSGKPFCFWFGSQDPHRPYQKGAGARAGLKAAAVDVPPWLPDTPAVRSDILDYYFEVQRFDRDVGRILSLLKNAGLLDDTIVVVTSDNGMPFLRAKTNVYDSGTHIPLCVRWPRRVPPGRTVDALVSLTDLAPTFLEAAGIKPPPDMTSQSLISLLVDSKDGQSRDKVFIERERHANVRAGDLSYPVRAIRTRDFLYVRNLRPDRWPCGDPEMWKAVGTFGDCDDSLGKEFALAHRNEPPFAKFFALALQKRAGEELYDMRKDPSQLTNVVGQAEYATAKKKLREQLDAWMRQTKDPRVDGDGDVFDTYPYFGEVRKLPGHAGK